MGKTRKAEPTIPFLPGIAALPDDAELVEVVRQSNKPSYTGKTAVKNHERAQAICRAILSGMGVCATASTFKVSTRTVHNIMRILRERGELQPMAAEILSKLDQIIDVGTEVWLDALERGKISPGQVPIPVLAAIDKRAQLSAGIVLGTGRTEREIRSSDVESAFALVKGVKAVDVTPAAVQSDGSEPKPKQIEESALLDTSVDTADLVPDPILPPLPAAPAAQPEPAADASASAAGRAKAGGGVPPNPRGGLEPTDHSQQS